ncbi:BnaA09g26400D [Brassica napus]|uniref:BnaA09g26400D protein n=1 Tax=Brassica napus TaxID=3708 RepID=A0A078GM26_BRANA|nr:BnaA09g26400D [Brassica napus]
MHCTCYKYTMGRNDPFMNMLGYWKIRANEPRDIYMNHIIFIMVTTFLQR